MQRGVVTCKERIDRFEAREAAVKRCRDILQSIRMSSRQWLALCSAAAASDRPVAPALASHFSLNDGRLRSAFDVIGYDSCPRCADLLNLLSIASHESIDELTTLFSSQPHLYELLSSDSVYSVELSRQAIEVDSMRRDSELTLPPSSELDYASLQMLSSAEIERLTLHRPHTMLQLQQMSGISQSSQLAIYMIAKQKQAEQLGINHKQATKQRRKEQMQINKQQQEQSPAHTQTEPQPASKAAVASA